MSSNDVSPASESVDTDNGNSVESAESQLARLSLQFLVHSFLYYRLGKSVIDDPTFDSLTERLIALRKAHPKASLPHGKLLEPVLGPEASGYRIRDYPPRVISAAFKLLYAAESQAAQGGDFAEFVERHGYSVSRGGDKAP